MTLQPMRLTTAGVAKATDENLTSENWEFILVCAVEEAGGSSRAYHLPRMFATKSKAAMLGANKVTPCLPLIPQNDG
jgi:hypothetical protein